MLAPLLAPVGPALRCRVDRELDTPRIPAGLRSLGSDRPHLVIERRSEVVDHVTEQHGAAHLVRQGVGPCSVLDPREGVVSVLEVVAGLVVDRAHGMGAPSVQLVPELDCAVQLRPLLHDADPSGCLAGARVGKPAYQGPVHTRSTPPQGSVWALSRPSARASRARVWGTRPPGVFASHHLPDRIAGVQLVADSS